MTYNRDCAPTCHLDNIMCILVLHSKAHVVILTYFISDGLQKARTSFFRSFTPTRYRPTHRFTISEISDRIKIYFFVLVKIFSYIVICRRPNDLRLGQKRFKTNIIFTKSIVYAWSIFSAEEMIQLTITNKTNGHTRWHAWLPCF